MYTTLIDIKVSIRLPIIQLRSLIELISLYLNKRRLEVHQIEGVSSHMICNITIML